MYMCLSLCLYVYVLCCVGQSVCVRLYVCVLLHVVCREVKVTLSCIWIGSSSRWSRSIIRQTTDDGM